MKKRMILSAILATGLAMGPVQAKWAPLELVDSIKKLAKTKLGLNYTAQAIDEFVAAMNIILEEASKPQDQMNKRRLAAALIRTNNLIIVLKDIRKEILDPLAKGLGIATSIVKKGTKEKHIAFWKKFLAVGLVLVEKSRKMIERVVGLLDKDQIAEIKQEIDNKMKELTAEQKEQAKKLREKLLPKSYWSEKIKSRKRLITPVGPAGTLPVEKEVTEIEIIDSI